MVNNETIWSSPNKHAYVKSHHILGRIYINSLALLVRRISYKKFLSNIIFEESERFE